MKVADDISGGTLKCEWVNKDAGLFSVIEYCVVVVSMKNFSNGGIKFENNTKTTVSHNHSTCRFLCIVT